MLHDQDFLARFAAIVPIAQRHLERDLDRSRPAVGKENMLERIGQEIRKALRQLASGLMSPPGKDHLVQPRALLLNRGDNFRMTMAMRLHPPAGYGVDDLRAIRRIERGTLGSSDLRDRLAQTVLCERVPDIDAHDPKSAMEKFASKAAFRVVGESWSIIGNRPRRRTAPIAQIVCSLSRTSGPVKAMP